MNNYNDYFRLLEDSFECQKFFFRLIRISQILAGAQSEAKGPESTSHTTVRWNGASVSRPRELYFPIANNCLRRIKYKKRLLLIFLNSNCFKTKFVINCRMY